MKFKVSLNINFYVYVSGLELLIIERGFLDLLIMRTMMFDGGLIFFYAG